MKTEISQQGQHPRECYDLEYRADSNPLPPSGLTDGMCYQSNVSFAKGRSTFVNNLRVNEKVEKYVLCERKDGGNLLTAALMKQDEALLLDLRGKDHVAIEVRYHKSCYYRYTKVALGSKLHTETAQQMYERSYSSFCRKIVEERIIKGKEILRLTKLNQLFIKEVKDVEGLDASSYKTSRSKARLKSTHPALCFTRPSRKVESDIVFVETLAMEEVVEDAVQDMSSEDSESSGTSIENHTQGSTSQPHHLRDMFHAPCSMAMVQEMSPRHIPRTFGKLAEYLLKQLVDLALSVRSNVIHFVVDTYRNDSIKNAERGRRSIGGSVLTKIYSEEQQVPHQSKKFLACRDNKAELIRFLFQTWRKMPSAILKNVTVFAAHDEECHEITAENGQTQERLVPELQCNHEEADTRLFLHCQYAARQQPTRVGDRAPHPILIKSPDTDVFIIGVAVSEHIEADLLFHTGRGNNRRTLNLSKISS